MFLVRFALSMPPEPKGTFDNQDNGSQENENGSTTLPDHQSLDESGGERKDLSGKKNKVLTVYQT